MIILTLNGLSCDPKNYDPFCYKHKSNLRLYSSYRNPSFQQEVVAHMTEADSNKNQGNAEEFLFLTDVV